MKIKNLRTNFVNSLSEIYDSDEILSFFYILSEDILGLTRVAIAINLDKKLSDNELFVFGDAIKKLQNQEPIQYIIGNTNFYGLSFHVDKQVLIPRPETEELVNWIIKDQEGILDSITILDIGTGSGCIAISLAKNLTKAIVYAIDVSEEAIKIAKKNAKKNQVSITFIHLDILEVKELPENFDIIVSNPPYVRELEKQEMKPNVLDNEPSLALFVQDNNPLIFYEKITGLAKRKLKQKGKLYFEINQYLALETKNMILDIGFNIVEVRKDLYGNERMICAYFG
ncbi:peptide chain release factor N(5)-glutamine methyltransferase [Aquimarina longa]|uniref:peptide chain release factor N(5)-glutamine methyltransferase n=1 Tax=Aquimarina longa TaxID=1080221 RepID=UPI000783D52C|nr:peptide chain release factor N(5)-glutamine methyltransferase [Aquimarina longa]